MKNFFNKNITRLYKYFMLTILQCLKLKLNISKKIKGINSPIIHVYSVCWNEEKFLPFYLKHYSSFADKIIIYDNESTDNTLKILKENPKVEIKTYKTNGKLNDFEYLKIKNNAWKKSRGKADWVIVCDIDELLYPAPKQDIKQTLQKTDKTIIQTEGYNMISELFPKLETPLLQQTKGEYSEPFSKTIIFNPHKIVSIKYYPGCHYVESVIGKVKYGYKTFRLFHFKNMSLEYLLKRHETFYQRLSQDNKENKLGIQYGFSQQSIINDFNNMLNRTKQITE